MPEKWGLVQLGKYGQGGEGRKPERIDENLIIKSFNLHSRGFRITFADNREPLTIYLSAILYNIQTESCT